MRFYFETLTIQHGPYSGRGAFLLEWEQTTIAINPLQGGETMELIKRNVQWETSYQEGLSRAGREGKPILLDFFKDG